MSLATQLLDGALRSRFPKRRKNMNPMNSKVITGFLLISLFVSSAVFAGPTGALKKGYIQNDKGEKCWYTQIVKEENTYFHGSLKGANGIITFDNPKCMSDSGLGLDVNKMMINNIIAKWYSHTFLGKNQERPCL
jgi:hypothetical protein